MPELSSGSIPPSLDVMNILDRLSIIIGGRISDMRGILPRNFDIANVPT